MITDAILDFLTGVLHSILGALPTVSVPGWLEASGPVATVFADAGSMGAWFPTTLAGVVLAALLAAWGTGFVIKAIRIVASFFTAGGGSAA